MYFYFQIPCCNYSPVSPPITPAQVEELSDYLRNESPGNLEILDGNRSKPIVTTFKKVVRGRKVIRIEIYDADQFENVQQSMCNCSAEICVQHVVENIVGDDIYSRIRDVIQLLCVGFNLQMYNRL